ncbi:Mor transcription activator family protein [Vibrio quintilis]|uniref:Mor transcription activator family protein n=1 Tax=Vibrio quintilis TaxID=1117707 RepID=A0A1M7YU01_9VIBR|nr:Mor transcription activator family protein [Vibrio quintilis]SHO56072.1 Mor transcription activator family protein [Vibrio quintilis]
MDNYLTKKIIDKVTKDPSIIHNFQESGVNWPDELSGLYETLDLFLSDYESVPEEAPLLLTLLISDNIGGIQFYLPKANKIKQSLRNIIIQNEFNGFNTHDLAQEYHLSDKTINEILKSNTLKKTCHENTKYFSIRNITPPSSPNKYWDKSVLEFYKLVQQALSTIGMNEEANAVEVAFYLMQSFGGCQRYFPKADKIQEYLTSISIYSERKKGKSVNTIAKLYKKSPKTIYEICARMEKHSIQTDAMQT